jgi:hypothetical protein
MQAGAMGKEAEEPKQTPEAGTESPDEKLKEQEAGEAAETPETEAESEPPETPEQEAAGQPWPPAEPNLPTFLAGLYTQTLVMLGAVENPVTKKTETNIREARYLIDVLELLRTKMEGNLDETETRYFEQVLYDLRMRFISASK